MTLEYWLTRQATGENGHLNYLGLGEHERKRSEWLVEQVESMNIPKDARILEVGCGCGRNLWYLMRAGYSNVCGIEANKDRAGIAFLSTGKTILNSRVGKIGGTYDLAYSMAVLEHVDNEADIVAMIEQTKTDAWLTIEGENKNPSERHFPRNYQTLFEAHGWAQQWSCNAVPGLAPGVYVARWFER